jgi:hypothetical protein
LANEDDKCKNILKRNYITPVYLTVTEIVHNIYNKEYFADLIAISASAIYNRMDPHCSISLTFPNHQAPQETAQHI